MDHRLLIATGNKGKIAELGEMLRTLGVEAVGLDQFPSVAEVAETGSTFAENAVLKAAGYARATGLAAIADDSGLEVAALNGRPGVLSARYGGDDVPFSRRMRLLLDEIEASRPGDRAARFVCAMAFVHPDGEIEALVEGACDGLVASAPRGTGGFGYDPIFIPAGYGKTFGELSYDVKARISHRSRAFSLIMPVLARFFGLST